MDDSRTMPRLCLIISLALAVIGAALRTVCMFCCFDADPGYFSPGILPTLSNILYFVAVSAAVVCAVLTPKGQLPTELHIPHRAPVSILLGVALAAFTVVSLLIWFPARKSDLMLAPAILGLLASTYYILSYNRDGRYPDWLSLVGYLPALWSISAVAETYFDPYTVMNSPVKISLQMGFLGFAFICLAELRFRVGRAIPRYSLALLSIGSFTCLVGSVPTLIATGAQILRSLPHLLYAVVLLFAGLYGFYTLLHLTYAPATEADEAPLPVAPADPNAE